MLGVLLGEVHALKECSVPHFFSQDDPLKKKEDGVDLQNTNLSWHWLVAILLHSEFDANSAGEDALFKHWNI